MKKLCIVVAVAMAVLSSSYANTERRFGLTGSQEVPAVNTSHSGIATIRYDAATRELVWRILYTGLTGSFTGAHFHGPAGPGTNASVVVNIGSSHIPDARMFAGATILTEEQASWLLAGDLYVNIHSSTFPGGEIRGQVVETLDWLPHPGLGWLYHYGNGAAISEHAGGLYLDSSNQYAFIWHFQHFLSVDHVNHVLWSPAFDHLWLAPEVGERWYYSTRLGYIWVGFGDGSVWHPSLGRLWTAVYPHFWSDVYGWVHAPGNGQVSLAR